MVAPVGIAPRGAGLWGHLDLAGNVSEWTLDWSGDYGEPCADCADLEPGSGRLRVSRGGSFVAAAESLSAASAGNLDPTARSREMGFRCARAP
jgi:formylglycine-generating enzyme required for sulfatase activity